MSINIGDNFSYLGKKFLDNREHFETVAKMKACNDVPNGFITYCDETNTRYEYHTDNEEDATLGKWRVFKSVPDVNFDEYVTQDELEEAIKDVDVTSQLENYATKEYVDNAIDGVDVTEQLKDYAKKTDIPNVPTKTSELTNDSGYLTNIPSEYITETELNAKGYLTEHQSLEDYAKKSELHNHSNKSVLDSITSDKVAEWDNKSTFDGDYNSLTNKPTIPTVTNDLTNELKSNYDTAYDHSQSAHAPSDAQKNSDITKVEIEAKLTGNINSHTHEQYLTEHQDLSHLVTQDEFDELELIETSTIQPTDEDVVLWIDISEDTQTDTLARINDNTIARNTTWSSEKNNDVYATKDDVPTRTSQLTNDSNFLTSIPSEYVTDSELNSKGYSTEEYVDEAIEGVDVTEQLQDYVKKTDVKDIPTKVSQLTNDMGYITNIPSTYATTSYVDNKITELNIIIEQLANRIAQLENDNSGSTEPENPVIPCTSITLNNTSLTFDSFDTIETLLATVEPSNTTDVVYWTCNNTNVARVDNGYIAPISNGSCIITATCGSKSATCSITINVQEVEDPSNNVITLSHNQISSSVIGSTHVITATLSSSLQGKTISWTSSNKNVAMVSAYLSTSGLVRVVGEGTTIITATCGSVSATCSVNITTTSVSIYNITRNLTNVTSSNLDSSINAGESYYTQLTCEDGYEITSVQVMMNGVDITDSVYVPEEDETIPTTIPCTSISLNKSSLTFDTLNSTQTLTASVLPTNTTDTVTWSIDKPSIITISNGIVTAKANGSCTITAKCGNQIATCSVLVSKEGDM